MAKETAIELRLDRDQQFVFTVLNEAETAAINVATWAMSFMVKRHKSDADAAALITKTGAAVVVSGVYDASPAVNTQRATVTVEDSDCESTTIPENLYYYELERTDAGFETPLAEGTCYAILGVQR